jgi:hypothetical protein
MSKRGSLLFSDDFSSGPVSKNWRVIHGQWDIVDGMLKGVENKAENHYGAVRHTMNFHDAVFQFSFKLDGAKSVASMLNREGGRSKSRGIGCWRALTTAILRWASMMGSMSIKGISDCQWWGMRLISGMCGFGRRWLIRGGVGSGYSGRAFAQTREEAGVPVRMKTEGDS